MVFGRKFCNTPGTAKINGQQITSFKLRFKTLYKRKNSLLLSKVYIFSVVNFVFKFSRHQSEIAYLLHHENKNSFEQARSGRIGNIMPISFWSSYLQQSSRGSILARLTMTTSLTTLPLTTSVLR